MISRLISASLVDQVAPHDRLVRDLDGACRRGDLERSLARGHDLTTEAGAAGDLGVGAQRDAPADGAAEVAGFAKRPRSPGRRDVDRVAVEVAAEHVRDALAERVVDPSRV